MESSDTVIIIPTWGYRPDGAARIFDLARGDGLPDGWHASPDCITDPDRATAEALSAAAEGRPYEAPAFDEVSGFRVERTSAEADDLTGALAEISRLQSVIEAGTAENERLIAEIEAAEGELDAAAQSIVDLQAALVKAQEDGGFAVTERDAATASLEALKDELTKVRADLDAASASKAAKPAMVPFGIAGTKASELLGLADRARTELRLAYRIYDARRPMRIEPFWGRRGSAPPIVQASRLAAPPPEANVGPVEVIVDGGREG